MSRSAVWWELHRAGVAGSAMAVVAVVLLGWVGLNVLVPLHHGASSSSAFSQDPELGTLAGTDAGSAGVGGGSGSLKSAAVGSAESGTDPEGAGPASSSNSGPASNPEATGAGPGGTGAPVLSSEDPDVKPTVQKGEKITLLSDVLFQFGSFDLSDGSQARLDTITAQIREAGVEGDIQVNGYTDSIGTDADNMALSQQRALAVANALSQRLDGVNVQLNVQAFGESSPRKTNTTAEGRRQNRRVIVVLPEKH